MCNVARTQLILWRQRGCNYSIVIHNHKPRHISEYLAQYEARLHSLNYRRPTEATVCSVGVALLARGWRCVLFIHQRKNTGESLLH